MYGTAKLDKKFYLLTLILIIEEDIIFDFDIMLWQI